MGEPDWRISLYSMVCRQIEAAACNGRGNSVTDAVPARTRGDGYTGVSIMQSVSFNLFWSLKNELFIPYIVSFKVR